MQTRSEQRRSRALGDALLSAAMLATVALTLVAGWLLVKDLAGMTFSGVEIDPATRDALLNSEPAPLWQQLLVAAMAFGMIASPFIALWVAVRSGQALHQDLLALRPEEPARDLPSHRENNQRQDGSDGP